MRWAVSLLLIAAAVVAVPGCGKPPMVTVKGVVKVGGKPVPHCKVGLFPDVEGFDPNKHGYGFGMTNDKGEFEIQHPNGTKGIFPGTYKVTFVAWIDSKGKPVPPETKPSEVPGGVKNLLPSKYESLSDTPERLTVTKEGAEANFDLSAQ
ncbi:hypothetical protein R5W23_005201 [Gemmata sp. JC673]|uniref:Carboxypeptidase regulatory-like domain-containing protein n=1 Tax=Gemmata algarum TaxID=2975278 RepID=A0ABU5F7S4_9BACT|nr:hypothetical protein [Gemmata algarum]MDY3563587.1 hypothetical protein [Gemmata algarum]